MLKVVAHFLFFFSRTKNDIGILLLTARKRLAAQQREAAWDGSLAEMP
jgi:hypothetical protein